MGIKRNYKGAGIMGVILLFIVMIFSCGKDTPERIEPEKKNEKWRTTAIKDSMGNQYYAVATINNTLEIRVDSKDGRTVFAEVCPTIDPTEIPADAGKTITVLVSPSKYISINDATFSIKLVLDAMDKQHKYVQLLANINVDTKKFYTKKYKVEKPEDWTYKFVYDALAQWYQNTLIVKEGTEYDLNRGGGHMGLGQRGTQLVCYERDFSTRYTKDIDAPSASYPSTGGQYIPINNYEMMGFRSDGLISRIQIVTSIEDVYAGKKEIVWQNDLKKSSDIPADYSVKITNYNIQGDEAIASYTIFDEKGAIKYNRTGKWALSNGFPRGYTTE
ncbi:hypothetical protein [Chryseobacterium kwangjuense]|uniref:Uncharacterized protein n=1 Tax=Chryseobacterium kwangjuense TaxID=267125 RepID=A0A135WIV7_9FLAO|nr:hypothetical protein [Chryseobacterium kwangjuense]KXH84854.1 hypothetical protein AU378_03605 [Chryseobacterium kwangjuense]